jgi:hypothetical protein
LFVIDGQRAIAEPSAKDIKSDKAGSRVAQSVLAGRPSRRRKKSRAASKSAKLRVFFQASKCGCFVETALESALPGQKMVIIDSPAPHS